MSDITLKVLFTVLGLYTGVLSWLLKTAWNDIQSLKSEIHKIRADVSQDLDRRFDQFLRELDHKLDSWWAKIEVNLMNDGRIPPKRPRRSPHQGD